MAFQEPSAAIFLALLERQRKTRFDLEFCLGTNQSGSAQKKLKDEQNRPFLLWVEVGFASVQAPFRGLGFGWHPAWKGRTCGQQAGVLPAGPDLLHSLAPDGAHGGREGSGREGVGRGAIAELPGVVAAPRRHGPV